MKYVPLRRVTAGVASILALLLQLLWQPALAQSLLVMDGDPFALEFFLTGQPVGGDPFPPLVGNPEGRFALAYFRGENTFGIDFYDDGNALVNMADVDVNVRAIAMSDSGAVLVAILESTANQDLIRLLLFESDGEFNRELKPISRAPGSVRSVELAVAPPAPDDDLDESGGPFLAVWREVDGIFYAREIRTDDDGGAAPFEIAGMEEPGHQVVLNHRGEVTAFWAAGTGGQPNTVTGRRFLTSGEALGPAFVVTTAPEPVGVGRIAAVIADGQGSLLVAWESYGDARAGGQQLAEKGRSQDVIRVRRLLSSGEPDGEPTTLDADTGYDTNLGLWAASDHAGRAVLVWLLEVDEPNVNSFPPIQRAALFAQYLHTNGVPEAEPARLDPDVVYNISPLTGVRMKLVLLTPAGRALMRVGTTMQYYRLDDPNPDLVAGGRFSGSWYAPVQDGQGFFFEVLGNGLLQAYWFTYDDAGNQDWQVGLGPVEGNAADLEVIDVSGGAWVDEFDPGQIVRSPWGYWRVRFVNCNRAVVSYRALDGRARSFAVRRLTVLDGLPCGNGNAKTAPEPGGEISGSWFDPAQSGHGWAIEKVNEKLVQAYWFAFDTEGNRMWLVGLGELMGNEAVLDTIVTSGGRFDTPTAEAPVTREHWGVQRLQLSDCGRGQFAFEGPVEFGAGALPVSHFTHIAGLECEPTR